MYFGVGGSKKMLFLCSEICLSSSYLPRGPSFFLFFGGNGVALHRWFSSAFLLCTRLFLASGFRSPELQRNEERARATLLAVLFRPSSRSSGRVFRSYKTMVNGRQKSSEFDRFSFGKEKERKKQRQGKERQKRRRKKGRSTPYTP